MNTNHQPDIAILADDLTSEELEACFKASGRTSLVFAPAFPEAAVARLRGARGAAQPMRKDSQ